MPFVKISRCHLREQKCELLSIWKCFNLHYKGHLSLSSGSHLPSCHPYLIYGSSLLSMPCPSCFLKLELFDKPMLLLIKYDQ